jgi:hypothetical protein
MPGKWQAWAKRALTSKAAPVLELSKDAGKRDEGRHTDSGLDRIFAA